MANRKAFTVGGFLIGLLVFGALLAGFMSFLLEFEKKYTPVQGVSSQLTSLNKFNETTETINLMANQTRSDDLTAIGFFTKGSWAAMGLVFNSFEFMADIINTASRLIGVPEWFGALIIGIILISITLAILGAIFRAQLL